MMGVWFSVLSALRGSFVLIKVAESRDFVHCLEQRGGHISEVGNTLYNQPAHFGLSTQQRFYKGCLLFRVYVPYGRFDWSNFLFNPTFQTSDKKLKLDFV